MFTALRQVIRRTSQPSRSQTRIAHPRASARPPRRNARSYSDTPFGDRSAVGVFTPKAAAVFIATGVGLYFYFRYEKAQLLEQRKKELESRAVGRAHVGGPFTLTTHHGKPFSELDLIGRWNLLYFGFTNCPDICPAELDKMGVVLDALEKEYGQIFQPLFISVDPARDTLPQIARYLSDFHPRFTGLTADYNAVKAMCKAFRVYFSTPPGSDPKGDYLVDHSIFVYLMDPRGEFVEAFGQVCSAEDITERVRKEIGMWEKETGKKV